VKKRIYYDNKRTDKKGHKKGIMALDFNENLILLISAGFDHSIKIWNPYIDDPVYTLEGHTAPIISLKFINDPLHIISIDTESVIKIWDVKKFKCVDSLVIDSNEDQKQVHNSV
jgi:WD40 repeat protein